MKGAKGTKKEAARPEVTMRERLLKELGHVGKDVPRREVSVMTRLGAEVVEFLDALVKLNLFRSRSEVVAAIVESKVLSNLDLFNTIRKQALKLDEMQEELESLTFKALRD
ncbi:MAG: hypothetical protein ACW99U_14975 [Candidatus Thorarchaeota archaeon]|jgi:Arc/MetJ-type ribon-helix-helix transcriptional regulator